MARGSKVLIGHCSNCNRKNSVPVSDSTIQTEGLSDFFKVPFKKNDLMYQKRWQKT